MAFQLGDPTAKSLNRLTLNPWRHVSIVGSILIPLLLFLAHSPVLLGWAKPVPINPNYFRRPLRGMALVAAAGPITNLTIAVALALLFRGLGHLPENFGVQLASVCLQYGIMLNVGLAVFNLLPIPPLDGSRIVTAFLPTPLVRVYVGLERFGILIVFGLLYLHWLDWLTVPMAFLIHWLTGREI